MITGSIVESHASFGFVHDLPPDPKTGKRRQKKRRAFPSREAAAQALAESLAGAYPCQRLKATGTAHDGPRCGCA